MVEVADFDPAVAILLSHEGSAFVPKDAGNAGCVRWGLTQRYVMNTKRALTWEDAYEYVRALPQQGAETIYRADFWEHYQLGKIENQQAATILFSMLVNQRPSAAVKALQRALAELGADIEVDGVLGPVTIAALNSYSWDHLRPIWHDKVEAHYRNIAPMVDDGKHLKGWLRRADELFKS